MTSQTGADRAVDEPETLFDLAMNAVVADTEVTIDELVRAIGPRRLYGVPIKGANPGPPYDMCADWGLPIEVCERFLAAYQRRHRLDDDVAHLLSQNPSRLRRVALRNARTTDRGLGYLLKHKPRELDLVDCELLTRDTLRLINENSENLVSLKLVHLNRMWHKMEPESEAPARALIAPALKLLTIRQRGLKLTALPTLTPLTGLTYLDLSECKCVAGVAGTCLERLEVLILHGVPILQELMDWIYTLKNLHCLDVSQANERLGKYHQPNAVLAKLATSLPRLSWLDISGTNLAGSGTAREVPEVPLQEPVRCDIPGLVSRAARPLNFLGLYGTKFSACKRHDIPALTISGDANEEQILTSAGVYMERPEILTRVLNDLYFLFRYQDNRQVQRALHLVLQAMDRHRAEKTVQISGSATLFYIVKDKEMESMRMRVKRRIITTLLLGMEAHMDDETMMRNGCLGLTRFSIPTDVLFQYEKMATVLLTGALDPRLEDFVRRMGIYLLNSLACQVDTVQKQFLGKCGAIGTMLNIIAERLRVNTCDTMLEMAWSTLWNMTDETPDNCARFLRMGGLDLFLACLKSFPNKDDQLRNMMGLLGNVAENPPLRRHIVTPHLLGVFYTLLDSSRDGIEVSYNAGGVLAHIASDGAEAWTAREPAREAVLARLAAAIESWDLHAERNINYRSFRPILSLLRAHHTPQCQHWAAWALANLTTVYPDKYCKLIQSEGGLELLESVCAHEAPYERVKQLCQIVMDNVNAALAQPAQQ